MIYETAMTPILTCPFDYACEQENARHKHLYIDKVCPRSSIDNKYEYMVYGYNNEGDIPIIVRGPLFA